MTIYKIDNGGFRYQELDLLIDDFIDAFPDDISDIAIHEFRRNNLELAPHWPSLATGFSVIEGRENPIRMWQYELMPIYFYHQIEFDCLVTYYCFMVNYCRSTLKMKSIKYLTVRPFSI